ncbi:hypothetical protein J6590_023158 [Homalodisca vitripennis]|nr:hypothetical protein J6590_023158 [Homalodisca vitripennis]
MRCDVMCFRHLTSRDPGQFLSGAASAATCRLTDIHESERERDTARCSEWLATDVRTTLLFTVKTSISAVTRHTNKCGLDSVGKGFPSVV